jgi:hypothetical protein
MKLHVACLFLLLGVFSLYGQKQLIENLKIEGYDSHIELNWDQQEQAKEVSFNIYGKFPGDKEFRLRGSTTENQYIDFVTGLGRNIEMQYKVVPVMGEKEKQASPVVTAAIRDFSDEELLEMVQRYTFRFFWDYGDSNTGLSRERTNSTKGRIITIGGSGFGIMAVIVAAERGWISREQAVDKLLQATHFLETTDRFHGMWAHWYNAETGKVREFGKMDNGGDIVESSFMMQGLLTAQQYFNQDNEKEKTLRERITRLWHEMEWDWYTKGEDKLIWHWSPDYGFKKDHGIRGYNECLITYILAISSPTHPISEEAYHKSWAGWDNDNFANYTNYYGITLPLGNKRWFGGPLFFSHYSYLGLDPRGLQDRYANYWEQNRRHTLVNRAYCIDNPLGWKGYGEDFWGLTACDKVPTGYSAHAPGYRRDFGTVAPTAALSSMPYTPEESIKVLKNLYRNLGRELWGPYGFYDAINLSISENPEEQVRKNYIGIDQGPIIVMIENYRSGLLWDHFMQNKDVLNGLKKLGFTRYGKEIEVE